MGGERRTGRDGAAHRQGSARFVDGDEVTRIDLNAVALLGLLWLSVGSLAGLFLGWAFKQLNQEPPAPVYPLDMWRTRRDVTVLGPRPFDWSKDDEDGAA